jgi:hypothetical protein
MFHSNDFKIYLKNVFWKAHESTDAMGNIFAVFEKHGCMININSL